MKASKISDAQKVFNLKQGDDGVPIAEICRKAGIKQATFFNWRREYAGLLPDEMRRLKALEDENGRFDLLPRIKTIQSWNFPFMIPLLGEGDFHESIEVQ